MEISRVDTTAYSDSNVTTGQKTNDNQASNKTYKKPEKSLMIELKSEGKRRKRSRNG